MLDLTVIAHKAAIKMKEFNSQSLVINKITAMVW